MSENTKDYYAFMLNRYEQSKSSGRKRNIQAVNRATRSMGGDVIPRFLIELHGKDAVFID